MNIVSTLGKKQNYCFMMFNFFNYCSLYPHLALMLGSGGLKFDKGINFFVVSIVSTLGNKQNYYVL